MSDATGTIKNLPRCLEGEEHGQREADLPRPPAKVTPPIDCLAIGRANNDFPD